ncbi:MAG: bifunctional diaminohydroxyphosphoribosylaminopyrimidine deaminase/5-amino-6-(5-phosphoribosylamino)uracil reductase RibD [Alphaproteobacteria bacterium]|nr:bifunctional diaminohydroxyphosphoribosylaminopyrimidine deaminase/5-amino-6-(5-phosphoribosylamino)uracil reductase RibD [Alphaproteobacteria bacterium]
MRAALRLARRGLGLVWPNPAVGCVLVQHSGAADRIVGRGWTQPGGRPHAETEALARAGAAAQGATAYVSLEPCNHQGETPPCSEALIAAGVARVVAAIEDPDPRVSGGGLDRLAEAGIEVACGLCRPEAEALNAGFLMRLRKERPLVTLKTATTLDGRIATRTGESQWITGPEARAQGHRLRAEHDAIMVGVGTVAADDPALTCRLPGLQDRSPVRIVVDARLRLPLTAQLVKTAGTVPTWVIARTDADRRRAAALRDAGVDLIELKATETGYPDPRESLEKIAERGITRVLVEGGATLGAVLLRARLVDRIAWFRSTGIMGADGVPAVEAYGVEALDAMARFERQTVMRLGDDILETFAHPH